MLNNTAHQKPPTSKPGTTAPAKSIRSALITIKNNPKENTVIGRVNMTNIGLTEKFSKPKTTATAIAVRYDDTETPGIT